MKITEIGSQSPFCFIKLDFFFSITKVLMSYLGVFVIFKCKRSLTALCSGPDLELWELTGRKTGWKLDVPV